MGRHKKAINSAQRKAQKRRWQKASNATRREKYAADKAYRDEIKNKARAYEREAHGGLALDRRAICLDSLACMKNRLKTRPQPEGGEITGATSQELAVMMGLSGGIVLRGWQKNGLFPSPEVEVIAVRTHAKIYTAAQAVKLVEAAAEHFKTKSYLHADDKKTIAAFFAAMKP